MRTRSCVLMMLCLLAAPAWAQDSPRELQPAIPPERIIAAMGFMVLPDEPLVAGDVPVTLDVLYVLAGTSTATCPAITARFNEINANSGAGTVTIRTVGCRALAQASSGSLVTDLGRMYAQTDGWYDEIGLWRNELGADLVQMIVPSDNGGYAGFGYINSTSASSFSVVVEQYAVGYMSGPHEQGHNVGMNHDQANSNGGGPYPYSYGWRAALGSNWRTVMAYAPGDRIPYWSSPLVTCPGTPAEPCGTVTADNRRVLLSRAGVVSNFRIAPFVKPARPVRARVEPTL